MSQRRAGPCGLFSRAEEKKLSNDVIEEAFTSSATVCRTLFQALRNPLGGLEDRVAASSSVNAVNFSSGCTTKRFPRPAMRQQCRFFRASRSRGETRKSPSIRHYRSTAPKNATCAGLWLFLPSLVFKDLEWHKEKKHRDRRLSLPLEEGALLSILASRRFALVLCLGFGRA